MGVQGAVLILGTAKGVFSLQQNGTGSIWQEGGWKLEGEDISALAWDKRQPDFILAGTADGKLFVSEDNGDNWTESEAEFSGKKVWVISPDPHAPTGSFYIGVDGGYLFYTSDGGKSFSHLSGLRDIPESADWFGPFGEAIFHTLIPVEAEKELIYAGLSVVGVLKSTDKAKSWEDTTANIPRVPPPREGGPELADIHKLAIHPLNPARMYVTTHYGTFRSDDGAQSWENISAGLPYEMTRPLALHPKEPDTVYVIAHEDGSDTELPVIHGTVWIHRSQNAGKSWESLEVGLPKDGKCSVLREALTIDQATPCGLYLGTNKGQLFASFDEGDSWQLLTEVDSSIRVVRVQLAG
jgi:photosystem II stability/assembly factor-like uncharacterized protein